MAVNGNYSLLPVTYHEPNDESLDETLARWVIEKATTQQVVFDFKYDINIENFKNACIWILQKDRLINYKIYHDLIR